MKIRKYWIKERNNPQIGVYYVACGQMSISAARKLEQALYGDNVMLKFDTETDYQAKLNELQRNGMKAING